LGLCPDPTGGAYRVPRLYLRDQSGQDRREGERRRGEEGDRDGEEREEVDL